MRRLIMTAVLVLMMITPVWARWRLDKKEFKPTYQESQLKLPLRGVGVKTLFMMRIFVAGLYLDDKTSSNNVLNDVPKHLEVKFYATIKAKDFTKYTIDRMRANVSPEEFNKISDRFSKMGEFFPNIKSGDVFALTYTPESGTAFTHNGVVRGVIPGSDFAKAIFATWFGPKPIDNILKRQVLATR